MSLRAADTVDVAIDSAINPPVELPADDSGLEFLRAFLDDFELALSRQFGSAKAPTDSRGWANSIETRCRPLCSSMRLILPRAVVGMT